MRPHGSRLALLVAAAVGAAALTLLIVHLAGAKPSVPVRDSGAFAQAIACARPGGSAEACSAADRISSLPSQAAVISGDGTVVTWYSANGAEWQTTIASPEEATRLFVDNGYSNFSQDSSSSSNAVFSILLPNFVLLSPLVLIAVIIPVVIVRRRQQGGSDRSTTAAASAERCSFCGAMSGEANTLVRGNWAAICGPCAQTAAEQLRVPAAPDISKPQ